MLYHYNSQVARVEFYLAQDGGGGWGASLHLV